MPPLAHGANYVRRRCSMIIQLLPHPGGDSTAGIKHSDTTCIISMMFMQVPLLLILRPTPYIRNAQTANTVDVYFSEPVNTITAETLTNYTVDKNIEILPLLQKMG